MSSTVEIAVLGAERRLAREKRRGFWIRLFTLGIVNNYDRISEAKDHVTACREELERHRQLVMEGEALDDMLADSVVLEGARVSRHTFSDVPLQDAEDYGIDWDELRERVLARDAFTCQEEDGRCAGPLQAHHRVPLSKGGTNYIDNLQTLCYYHHSLKHEHMQGA